MKPKFIAPFRIIPLILIALAGTWFLVENQNDAKVPSAKESFPKQEKQSNLPGNFSVSDQGEGLVTMTVEYLPEQSDSQKIAFKVSLNTHSVDLESVNFTKDIWIEKAGAVSYPISSSDEGDNHHRASLLLFQKVPRPFKVIGQNIGGISRREVLLEIETP
ncbi:MAG: hypothetical protein Q8P89_05065 [bacterium]|nr:hypothetical protein [bacterium]